MELTVKLEDNVDVSLLKKILNQIKGIKSVEVSDDGKTSSWEEIESSEMFKKVLDKSFQQVENGEYVEYSEELMDKIFGK